MQFKKKCPTPCAQNNPCVHGTCNDNVPSVGSLSCTCATGYTGTNCEYGIKIFNIYYMKERKFEFF